MILILLFSCLLSHADEGESEVPVTPVSAAESTENSQMAQSRQIVDCLKVFLEDQIAAKEQKRTEWKQPEMVVYEKASCMSQLPVLTKVVVVSEKSDPL